MNRHQASIGQTVVIIISAILFAVLPSIALNLSFVSVCKTNAITLASKVNSVFWIPFAFMLVELMIAFTGNRGLSFILGLCGLISGIVIALCIKSILINGNYKWLIDGLRGVANLLPDKLINMLGIHFDRNDLYATIEALTNTNIDLNSLFKMLGIKMNSNDLIYILKTISDIDLRASTTVSSNDIDNIITILTHFLKIQVGYWFMLAGQLFYMLLGLKKTSRTGSSDIDEDGYKSDDDTY